MGQTFGAAVFDAQLSGFYELTGVPRNPSLCTGRDRLRAQRGARFVCPGALSHERLQTADSPHVVACGSGSHRPVSVVSDLKPYQAGS